MKDQKGIIDLNYVVKIAIFIYNIDLNKMNDGTPYSEVKKGLIVQHTTLEETLDTLHHMADDADTDLSHLQKEVAMLFPAYETSSNLLNKPIHEEFRKLYNESVNELKIHFGMEQEKALEGSTLNPTKEDLINLVNANWHREVDFPEDLARLEKPDLIKLLDSEITIWQSETSVINEEAFKKGIDVLEEMKKNAGIDMAM